MNLKIKTSESSKKNSLKIAFLLYFLISVQFVFAQNQTIDLNMTDKPLSEIFKSIEKQADISVDFDETQINIHIGEHQKQKTHRCIIDDSKPLKIQIRNTRETCNYNQRKKQTKVRKYRGIRKKSEWRTAHRRIRIG